MGLSLLVLRLHCQKMSIWNKNLIAEWQKIQTLNVCFWPGNFRGAKPACLHRLPESSHVSSRCNIGMLRSLQYRHRRASSGYAEKLSIEPHLWMIRSLFHLVLQHVVVVALENLYLANFTDTYVQFFISEIWLSLSQCLNNNAVTSVSVALRMKSFWVKYSIWIWCRNWDGTVNLRRMPHTPDVHTWSDKCTMFLLPHC
jgi:hypothetical protein